MICPLFSFAAITGRIVTSSYYTHFSPGEIPRFSATIQATGNPGDFNDLYIQVALTNHATGREVSTYPTSGDGLFVPGTIMTLTTGQPAPNPGGSAIAFMDWTAQAGLYTVTIILYRASDGAELNRVFGKEPVHVGSTTDSVGAFPRVLDLGALQYGRYMHPVPIEINWNFFSYSDQVRKDHPWYMRIYTDNHKRYQGVDGAIYAGRTATQESGSVSAIASPAGLISEDGRYTISLKIWCLNFGPDVEEGWDTNALGPPPVTEDYYWKGPLLDSGERDRSRVAWERIPDYIDMTADPGTWRKLIGQDPYDTHYASDSNPAGDFTLTSPFQVFIAYETSPVSVMGKYSADLIIEIYSP